LNDAAKRINRRNDVCILASHTAWGRELFDRLAEVNHCRWVFVDEPSKLADMAHEISPRFIFFPHWSFLIPEAVWRRHECVIFHMTDLPYGRGGSPLQNLIVRGHTETVVSALRCEAEVDAGPIYMKRPLSLAGSAREIFARAMAVIESMIHDMLNDTPIPQPQTGAVVHFSRRTPSQSDLAAVIGLDSVYDHIRMLDADGYPRAYLTVGRFRLEFDRATRTAEGIEARVILTEALPGATEN
jgi:methionyl-tRNA formyltransferase